MRSLPSAHFEHITCFRIRIFQLLVEYRLSKMVYPTILISASQSDTDKFTVIFSGRSGFIEQSLQFVNVIEINDILTK